MKASLHMIKPLVPLSVMLFPAQLLYAQNTAKTVDPYFWENVFGRMALIGGFIVIAVAFWTIVKLLTFMIKLKEIEMLREKGLEEVAAHYEKPQPPMLSKIWEKLQGAIPVAREKEILFDHEYDGIRELDNSLPPWWLWLFYITIAIAAVYLYVYHISGTGLSSKERYELQMETAQKEVEKYLSKQADLVNETNAVQLTDEKDLADGATIFKTFCVACHGQAGEGGVGPNMTDAYWIHGGDIKDLFKTIKYGVPEKGMISWSAQLRASEMQKVASYILTLQGTNPPNAKAPQGNLWQPGGEAMLQDTIVQ